MNVDCLDWIGGTREFSAWLKLPYLQMSYVEMRWVQKLTIHVSSIPMPKSSTKYM